MRNKLTSGVLAAMILAAVAFGAGYATRAWTQPSLNDFALVDEALGLLKAHYLRTLPDSLVQQRGMIRGLLESLHDPYTRFVEPSGHELETDTLAGEYGGIGAGLIVDSEGAVRLIPTPDGPAARAGVIENDILLAVDGVGTKEFPGLGDITAAIRGPAGTRVTLTLGPRTAGGDSLEISVVREVIDLPSATGYLLPEDETIGVVAVSVFSEKTSQEILDVSKDLAARGATALVLDLRGNGGGLLDSAVSVSRLFMDKGLIVVENRNDTSERSYSVETPGELAKEPLVVLVDGGTASAAEVVAAALQQNERAPLIGEATFGKGSVQVILPLSDGSSLHVTTAQWYTPNGQTLDGVGLEPDVTAARMDDGSDTALAQARTWLRGQGSGD
jgi:carboxyl-terminal processing protease